MAQVDHGDGWKKKRKTRVYGIYHTAQIGLEDRGRKNVLDLIWIEIGFLKIQRSPCNGNRFSNNIKLHFWLL